MKKITIVVSENNEQYAINLEDTDSYKNDEGYVEDLQLVKSKIDNILFSFKQKEVTERFNISMKENPDFDGNNYFIDDKERLTRQCKRVFDLMKDGKWRTLEQISLINNDPLTSISARLRDLRKPKFGNFVVNKRLVEKGLWEYQLDMRA